MVRRRATVRDRFFGSEGRVASSSGATLLVGAERLRVLRGAASAVVSWLGAVSSETWSEILRLFVARAGTSLVALSSTWASSGAVYSY